MFICEQYSERSYSNPCLLLAAEIMKENMWCWKANFQKVNKCNENFVAVIRPAFSGLTGVHSVLQGTEDSSAVDIFLVKPTDMCRNASTCKEKRQKFCKTNIVHAKHAT
jgi:hypothetical protein